MEVIWVALRYVAETLNLAPHARARASPKHLLKSQDKGFRACTPITHYQNSMHGAQINRFYAAREKFAYL